MTQNQKLAHARLLKLYEEQSRVTTHIQSPWERPEKKVDLKKCSEAGKKGKAKAMTVPVFNRKKKL